jgi:hypothetical protein
MSSEPRDAWIAEAEDFLVNIAPSGMGEARGSTIVTIDTKDSPNVAAAVFQPHNKWSATNIQAFVLRPSLRGRKLAEPALVELRDYLVHDATRPDFVMWSVREANRPMLSVSDRVGERAGTSDGLVRYLHP